MKGLNNVAYVLPRCLPEEQGVSSSGIQDFLNSLTLNGIELHSFMLMRSGSVIAEAWWPPYEGEVPHMIFSLSKCFTSTAVGLAVEEKRLSLDDRVVDFFSGEETLNDENLFAMRVRHLLTMSAGHHTDIMQNLWKEKDGNWLKAFLNTPVEHEPGSYFAYNNGAAYMLSAIVQKATGMTLFDYLKPRLFEPLGIVDATWDTCPSGRNPGGWGLLLKTEDIARFGQLYLNKGIWNGKRILPQGWIEEATSRQISIDDTANDEKKYGYGYQFRCNRYGYHGSGAFGQIMIVLPDHKSVVAITGATVMMQTILDMLWKHVIPAMGPITSQSVGTNSHGLESTIASLTYDPAPRVDSHFVLTHLGTQRRFLMESNNLGLQSFNILFNDNDCEILLADDRGEHRIVCGLGQWRGCETRWPSFKPHVTTLTNRLWRVLASGTWNASDTFVMTWRYVESPFWDRVTLRFDQERVDIEIVRNLRLESSFESAVIQGIADAGY